MVDLQRTAFVSGHARPKGSLDPQIVRGGGGRPTGRVRMVESSTDGPRWRRTIEQHVRAQGWPMIAGPCAVALMFWFDAKALGAADDEAHAYPVQAYIGDTDKLIRNVLDALTDARAYADDRQVVDVTAGKRWTRQTPSGTGVAGLGLRLWPL